MPPRSRHAGRRPAGRATAKSPEPGSYSLAKHRRLWRRRPGFESDVEAAYPMLAPPRDGDKEAEQPPAAEREAEARRQFMTGLA